MFCCWAVEVFGSHGSYRPKKIQGTAPRTIKKWNCHPLKISVKHISLQHFFYAIYPVQYPASCNFCPPSSTQYHYVWESQQTQDLASTSSPSYEQWVACLTSPDPGIQQDLVAMARTANRSRLSCTTGAVHLAGGLTSTLDAR